jgi:murein DD-endopeptidase MepM/ murein hydrolase activator NlpD
MLDVIPGKAGIQWRRRRWTPAFAGVTALILTCAFSASAELKILLSTTSISPGETLRVEVDGLNPNQINRLIFAKGTYQFFTIGSDAQRALVGIKLDAAPGRYPLKFQKKFEHPLHWETIATDAVEISSRVAPVEDINLPADKVALSQKYEHDEAVMIHKVMREMIPDQLWEGTLDYPVEGPVETEFGIHRFRNHKDAGWHRGMDFKAKAGDPVRASASGIVTFARPLHAHGRTVLINHGQGVTTIYLHMKSYSVGPGQKVVKGQEIGKVGSSGISTGAHMHWQVDVHGVPVNPKPWIETEF